MKKDVVMLVLIGMFLISPLVLAQEQEQVYSGFDRFVDNVKLFLSTGDNKVNLALQIREKEVDSAIVNLQNNKIDEVNDNLDNALDKLILVQERVSSDMADDVKESVDNVVNKIEESNLSETFDRYVLEEEKTELVAELVVEVEGKEGQTLTREVVQSENENRRTIKVTVRNENGEEIETDGGLRNDTATWEIVEGINAVDKGINDWVVRTYAEGTGSEGDDKSEIKTRIIEGRGTGESGVVYEGGEGNVVVTGGHEENEVVEDKNDVHYDPSKEEVIKNEIEKKEGHEGGGSYKEGTTAEGENNVDNGPCGEMEDCAP